MSKRTDLVASEIDAGTHRSVSTDGDPVVGKWYHVKGKETTWLGCVVHVGSNYVEIDGPSEDHPDSMHTWRVHFDHFWDHCEPAEDAEVIVRRRIGEYQDEARRLMAEVNGLVSRLGVGPRKALGDADPQGSETALVALHESRDAKQYGKDLVLAKEKTLPDLFEQIKRANGLAASWMKAELIPLKAQAQGLRSSLEVIEDRIFTVELYAGLVEEVVRVRKGAPAGNDEQIHLLQRRAYMDEECLARYESGGMEFHDIGDFDKWLARPGNFDRILPFPKCIVAFRVRRYTKERPWDGALGAFFDNIEREQADKATFLYIRNGEQVHRLSTSVEFGAQLFPDVDHSVTLGNRAVWARTFGGRVDAIISDDEYQAMLANAKQRAKAAKKDDWHTRHEAERIEQDYQKFSRESVYYDDILKKLGSEMKDHNRIVLVLQGLLDRSPVFHPHPPWRLWTEAGFSTGLKLVYDDSRAIAAGDLPDFESYRAGLNQSIDKGSLVVGHREVWIEQETARECARLDRSWRSRDRDYRPSRFIPYGNPGPSLIAAVEEWSRRKKVATFNWTRERMTSPRWYEKKRDRIPCNVAVSVDRLFNIDAYTPGDFRQFFDDPRTRAQYLKWAPFLLVAEDVKAGKRPDPRKTKPE